MLAEQRTDIVVYDKDEQLALVVEVKKLLGKAPEWAAKMRRNLLVHNAIPYARFFLLAFPDRFYLWTAKSNTEEETLPEYVIDPAPLLRPYYEKSSLSPETISEASFEIIVSSWLSEITWPHIPSEIVASHREWLVESGLFDAIQGGRVVSQVLV